MKARPNADGKSTLGLCYILLNPGRFLMIPLCGRGIGAGLNFLECGNRTRKGPSVYKTCRWHVFSEGGETGPTRLRVGVRASSVSKKRWSIPAISTRGCTPGNSRSSPRWWSRLFLPAFLPAGELRFCVAKWEFFKLPSNFFPELTER